MVAQIWHMALDQISLMLSIEFACFYAVPAVLLAAFTAALALLFWGHFLSSWAILV